MLIRRHDQPRDDREWRDLLARHRFGQLVASGAGRPAPVIAPAHYSYDGDSTILLHLTADNPIWEPLAENPMAVMAVVDAYSFIPSYWNEPEPHGVGTSYYAAVQAIGPCRAIDDPGELVSVLHAQMADLQPEGGLDPALDPDDDRYRKMLRRIRGIELSIEEVRAKFKFGGNKPPARRREIAQRLAERDGPLDAAARTYLLDRP